MRVSGRNMAGDTVDEIELRDDIFGLEPHEAVMHQAVLRQLANARLGTAETKTRTEVSGGGRKPWRRCDASL
jgi:large subunit ribosomal protein L4